MEIQPSNMLNLSGQILPNNSLPQHPQMTAGTATAVTLPVQQSPKSAKVSNAELQDAVASSNNFLKTVTNALEFSVDKDSGNTVVKVVDTATKEVIRQFPSEEMLAIAKALDKIQGLLIQQKA